MFSFLRVVFVNTMNFMAFAWDGTFGIAGNPAFLSMLGARLLFNMREAGEKGVNQGTSCTLKSATSNIEFAAPIPSAASESHAEVIEPEIIELEEVC